MKHDLSVRCLKRLAILGALLGLVPSLALANQYWVAYEGNDYPENEGWTRYATDPPAQRWLQDGSFFIDSRADPSITDNYGMYPAAGIAPASGETFVMTWRLNIYESAPWEDSGVAVTSDDSYEVVFLFAEDYLLSLYEPSVYVQFEPGVFHEYELRSKDMRTYELYLDGHLAVNGVFFEGLFGAGVWWGDIVRGGSSLAAWDYFHFGVVPEPPACTVALVALLGIRARRI